MVHSNGALSLRFHKSCVAAVLGFALAQVALAQSTGTEAIEESMSEVVVSATRVRQIGIVGDQTAPKSRVSLTGEFLESQTAGQSVFQSLNLIPGVTFTNNDPFGSSGGNLRIRGFDGSRVSVTFDGVPLNDSGNYALFPNQMLDSELIDRVDVNLGTTDVDSPTASATGGTVAYRTKKPTDEFGVETVASVGSFSYRRAFLRVDTGEFGPWGTKAFVAGSFQNYDKFKGPGELEKKQVNASIRQDFENGNFITLSGHYNENRNAFYRNASEQNFLDFGRDYENLASCTRDPPTFQAANPGDNENATIVASTPTLAANDNLANPASCTNYYGVRINPSDTGNIRLQSLWHLGEKLILTFDPSWQYTLANGGGTTTISETVGTTPDVRPIGTASVAGFDLNGDGDIRDTVRFYTPNNTNTKRWGATTSLIWNVNDDNRLRFAYTWDRARHRQTAQWGLIEEDGPVENVFGGRQGQRVYAADGDILRGRDRFSIAELKQYALEYRGEFFEDNFIATVGVRAAYFTRELNQYCYTPNGQTGNSSTTFTSSTLCTSRSPTATLANGNVIFQNPMQANPTQYIAPYSEEVEFDDIMPNLGLTWRVTDSQQIYFSYAEGLSAPRTDNLYSVRRLVDGSVGRPTPETEKTKAYDLGWRLNHSSIIASAAIYRIDYSDRIVSAFDQDLGFSVDRNVGDVEIEGFDGQIGKRVADRLALTLAASYNRSELLENIPTATTPILVKGKTLVESPKWTFSARMDFDVTDDLHAGIQAKKVGDRFGTDLNDQVAPGYTVVDLDLVYGFDYKSMKGGEVQLNVTNLLDEEYFGNISSGTGGASTAFYSIGAPRTVVASVKFNF
ncbi:MAG: TonB-dependent receptor [Steroidobacteraceae bacterium]|nr:TonB-dependent receptor [Steroidobacteraceae bacterium]